MMTDEEMLLMRAMNAVVHLIEHIDTEEPLDLAAAIAMLNDSALTDWIRKNPVLLPVRRDGVSLLERLDKSA